MGNKLSKASLFRKEWMLNLKNTCFRGQGHEVDKVGQDHSL